MLLGRSQGADGPAEAWAASGQRADCAHGKAHAAPPGAAPTAATPGTPCSSRLKILKPLADSGSKGREGRPCSIGGGGRACGPLPRPHAPQNPTWAEMAAGGRRSRAARPGDHLLSHVVHQEVISTAAMPVGALARWLAVRHESFASRGGCPRHAVSAVRRCGADLLGWWVWRTNLPCKFPTKDISLFMVPSCALLHN